MWIKLNEIPEEGRDFDFTEHDFELNEILKETLQNQPFRIQLSILPLGTAYQVKGHVSAKIPLTCSFCATDFQSPIEENFSDLLLTAEKRKHLISNPTNGIDDSDLSVSEVEGNQYNFGDYIRELIIFSEPLQPTCSSDCKGLCFECGTDLNVATCRCLHKKSSPQTPFSVLKDLKLD